MIAVPRPAPAPAALPLVLAVGLAAVAAVSAAGAEALVAVRTIPPRTVLVASDVSLIDGPVPGAHARIEDVIGLETRVPLYAGRPIRREDLGPPAAVERNAPVVLRYRAGALLIEAEGRALDRAAVGAVIRVMNLGSRVVVQGRVAGPSLVEVGR